MKKNIFLFALLASGTMVGQGPGKYLRLGKLTTTEINTIPVTNTDYTYTAFNTTSAGIGGINKGSGWLPRIPAGDFSTLTGNPYDNTNLKNVLNAKAGVSSNNSFAGRINFTDTLTTNVNVNLKNSSVSLSGKSYNGTSVLKGTIITSAPSSMASLTFIPTETPRYLSATDSDITYNGTSLLAGSSFASISGNPSDNTNLGDALDNKANDSDVMHKTGNELASGIKTFTGLVNVGGQLNSYGRIFQGMANGTSGKRWSFGKSKAAADGDFAFDYQQSYSTSSDGTYPTLYKLNYSGTPTDNTDLITKGYADSNYANSNSAGTDDQTSAEVSTNVANFDNNLSSADNNVQKALETLDDLNNIQWEGASTKTLGINDAGLIFYNTGSTTYTYTMPTDATADYGGDVAFTFKNESDGKIRIKGQSGVTIPNIELDTIGAFSIVRRGADNWTCFGDCNVHVNSNPEQYAGYNNALALTNNANAITGLDDIYGVTQSSVTNTSPAPVGYMWQIVSTDVDGLSRGREIFTVGNATGTYDVEFWARQSAGTNVGGCRFGFYHTSSSATTQLSSTWTKYKVTITINSSVNPQIDVYTNRSASGAAVGSVGDAVQITGMSIKLAE